MARGSFPYVFVTSVMAFAIAGMLWGVFNDGLVLPIVNQAEWQSTNTYVSMSRSYIRTSWEWLPFVILFGLGLTNIIAARARASAADVILRTVAVFVVHFFMVLWVFTFPEIGGELFTIFQNTPEMTEAGYMTAGTIAFELGIGYAPALFAIGIDIWYIVAPIRADFFGGIR